MSDITLQKCAESLLYAMRPQEPVMAAELKSYTVAEVANNPKSITGHFLKEKL